MQELCIHFLRQELGVCFRLWQTVEYHFQYGKYASRCMTQQMTKVWVHSV